MGSRGSRGCGCAGKQGLQYPNLGRREAWGCAGSPHQDATLELPAEHEGQCLAQTWRATRIYRQAAVVAAGAAHPHTTTTSSERSCSSWASAPKRRRARPWALALIRAGGRADLARATCPGIRPASGQLEAAQLACTRGQPLLRSCCGAAALPIRTMRACQGAHTPQRSP